MRKSLVLFVSVILMAAGTVFAQVPSVGPLTEQDVLEGLKSKNFAGVAQAIKQRGVAFEVDPKIEKKLRKDKANDQMIALIKDNGPAARAQRAKEGGGGPAVTKEEADAFTAVRSELDPDKAIQLAGDFAQKYPKSPLLTYDYWFEANGYQQKGDVEKAVDFGMKSLETKPDNLMALLLLTSMMPQPQYLKAHEMDKDKQLDQAEAYAKKSLQLIDQVPRQPNETDDQYAKRKANYASGAHSSLGMIHLERSQESLTGPDKDELAKAEGEYKTAIQTAEKPDARDYYRLGETLAMEGKVDEAIDAFSKASELGQGTMIKTYADQRVADLKKRKPAQPASGTQAPKPAAPETPRPATPPPSGPGSGQAEKGQPGKPAHPLTENEVIKMLEGSVPPARIQEVAQQEGIGFEMTAQAERELRKAGADDALVSALKGLAAPRKP